jgi:hypothetical protein
MTKLHIQSNFPMWSSLLSSHLFHRRFQILSTFSLPQMWPLNTGLTKLLDLLEIRTLKFGDSWWWIEKKGTITMYQRITAWHKLTCIKDKELGIQVFYATLNNISVTVVYCGDQICWWRKTEYLQKTFDLLQVTVLQAFMKTCQSRQGMFKKYLFIEN